MKSTRLPSPRHVGKAHILYRYVYGMCFFQCRFFNDNCSYDVMLSTNYITILKLSDFVPRIQRLGNQLQKVSFTAKTFKQYRFINMPFLIPETQCALNKKNCFRCGIEFTTSHADRVCANCRKPRVSPQENKELSFRERQVISLVSQGKANKEIAFELLLTEGTIKEYLNRIFRKVEVKNRTELAIWSLTRQETAA